MRTAIRLTDEDRAFIQSEVDLFKPHIAILEGVTVAEAIPVFEEAGTPIVLDMHNIESDLFRAIRRGMSLRHLIQDIFLGAERWRVLHRFDRDVSLSANETWVTSEPDRKRLREIGGSDSVVIPNPVPDENLLELPLDAERFRSPRILYAGHLAYPPNIKAAGELARRILPHIRGEFPDLEVTIAGRTPSRSVLRLNEIPDVTVVPDPPDLTGIIGQSAYALMPIRTGGGTRIKVLEAMAAGLVVIATDKAVEGLPLISGEHYLAADTPFEFAERLTDCCSDPDATAELARRAREFATQTFGSRELQRMIAARLRAVFDTHSASANKTGYQSQLETGR